MFRRQIHGLEKNKQDNLFEPLKNAVIDAALTDHKWDKKALDYLVSI